VRILLLPRQHGANDPFHINQETGGAGAAITNDTRSFLRAPLIRTPNCKVRVEMLAVADPIVTLSSDMKPITWIGAERRGRRGKGTRCGGC
jgi:hypothetical protein